MKNVKINAVALLSAFILLSACNNNPVESLSNQIDATDISKEAIISLPMEELSLSEIESLIFLREEEKVARDVYTYLYKVHGMRVFSNISKSEQTHMNTVKYLLDKYELTDPVGEDEFGVFVNEELQELYDKLIEQGSQSEVEALKVGALIEEVDILNIIEDLENVDNQDIELVYDNLEKGSENHLRAFVRNLSVRGENYIPQLLELDLYDSIVN